MRNISYYIGTGRDSKMYTLRMKYVERGVYGDVERDEYCQNLSTDFQKAVEKAQDACRYYNAPLHATEFSLDEIRRRTEEMIAARAAAALKAKQCQDEYEQRERKRHDSYMSLIVKGTMPFGKHVGERLEDIDPSYAKFFVENIEDKEDRVTSAIGAVFRKTHAAMFSLPVPNDHYFGSPGGKYELNATLIEQFSYSSQWGRTTIQKFVAESGECLVYRGSAPKDIDLAETVRIKFTVKCSDLYQNQETTYIKNVGIVNGN